MLMVDASAVSPFAPVEVFMKKILLALVTVLVCVVTAGAAKRPNVVLVITDDQGYGDLSCHGNPVL
ncbi:uncharacterized protein METZ01_LOCUS200647, partial [marine metagenome]